jgi:tetratricopeptide (TPR) repeat protein
MTAIRPNLLKLLAPLLAFGATLAVLLLAMNGPNAPDVPRGVADIGPATGSTDDLVRDMQRAVRANPGDASAYAGLGDAYLQKARETGDPGYYSRAERAYDAGLRRDPRQVDAVIGAGTLANLRHDFAEGERLGQEARRLEPELARPYTVLADAQIELGRYDDAAGSIQRLLDLKPGLAAYARASYYRELTGDVPGAVDAMRLAVSAGGSPEGVAYVQTLLGDLELGRGRLADASLAYRTALAGTRSYPPALVGLARIDAAGGRLDRSAARLRRAANRLPLTTTLTLLGEVEIAAGRRGAGRNDLAAARAQRKLYRAARTIPDAEAVVFEANHGSPTAVVELGRRVWREAPSIRSADALGWALTRAGRPEQGLAWARRALRTGSRDPLFRYHAAVAARRAGHPAEAARDLGIARPGAALLSPNAQEELR